MCSACAVQPYLLSRQQQLSAGTNRQEESSSAGDASTDCAAGRIRSTGDNGDSLRQPQRIGSLAGELPGHGRGRMYGRQLCLAYP